MSTTAESLITDHLDLWSSTIKAKKTTGRGSKKKQELYGIKKLRELILEFAVRGLLVPQDPNDEPASELLKKIAKRKVELIKSGQLKKQKETTNPIQPGPSVSGQLPKGWTRVKFGEVVYNLDSARVPLSVTERKTRQGNFDYYGASGVIDQIDDYIFEKPLLLIGEDGANLVNRSSPIAFIARGQYWVNNHAHVLDCLNEELLLYVCLHINAISLLPYITGTAQPKMNQAKMNSIILALPPLAEQHRIVAKVDELMALCDQLEQQQEDSIQTHQTLVKTLLEALTIASDHDYFQQAWQRIATNFDTLFTTESSIDQLKQTILQLAVTGKLVPQDPNDEPASELLKRIAKEKDQLIKDKKIKKQKPLSPIEEDDRLFQVPNSWDYCRLGEFSNIFSGASFKSQDFTSSGEVRVIKITNAGVNELVPTEEYLPTSFSIEYEQFSVFEGDIILALTRPYIAAGLKVSLCPKSYHNSLLNQRVAAIRPLLDNRYVYLYLRSRYVLNIYINRFSGNGLQPNLKMADVSELVVPVPPIEEQHRIVVKVDELMTLCDQLKANLNKAQETQLNLTDNIVSSAIR